MKAGMVMILGAASLLSAQGAAQVKKVAAQPTSPASGKEMFRSYCASCHGTAGKGDGPAASGLKKTPTDLTLLSQKSGGKYPAMIVRASIKDGAQVEHGSKDMPVWGPILSSVSGEDQGVVDQRVANLVNYIQSIQAK